MALMFLLGTLFSSSLSFADTIRGTVRHAETNAALSGFIVKSPNNKEAFVANNGSFTFEDDLAADTELRVFSANGVLFAREKYSENKGEFRIQPTGVIYDATTGKPAEGVILNILRDTASKSKISTSNLETKQQGQITDKHGLYRFDLKNYDGAAGVLLEVVTTGTTYQFPSKALPPPTVCPLNADESEVMGPISPSIQSSSSYCLGFSVSAGSSTLPIHNHIPVDGSASSLTIQHFSSKKQAAIGDVVTYTIRIENRGNKDYLPTGVDGGVWVQAAMSKGLRYIKGSAKASLNDVAIDLALNEGPSLMRFQQRPGDSLASTFALPAGSKLLIRYQTVVDLQNREMGVLSNRAQVMDPGGVGLSKVANAAIRFSGDPTFSKGMILGRVYCDKNGNGWADETDPGVYGAHVYIDTGRYAITDRNGLYHLTDIPPGLHVVKVDDNTVAPGSVSIASVSRSQQVNPGLSYRISFGFRCNTESVGPTEVRTVEKDEEVRIPGVVVVTGTMEAMDVLVDGERSAVDGTIGLSINGQSKGSKTLDLDWNPKAVGRPLEFDITVPKGTVQSRLWIELMSKSGSWVAKKVIHKAGVLGPRVSWNRTNAQGNRVDEPGTLYRARLEAVDPVGGRWHAVPVYFTIGAKRAGPIFISTVASTPLTRRKNLNGRTKRVVRELIKKSRDISNPQVLLRLGMDGVDLNKQVMISRQWMGPVLNGLVGLGFLNKDQIGVRREAGFSGIIYELYDADRSSSKVISVPQQEFSTPRVQVAGQPVNLDKKGRFVSVLAKSEHTVAAVEWINKDGIKREILVRLSDDSGIPKSRLVRADLGKKQIVVGGETIDLAALGLQVRLPYEVGRLDDGVPAEPILFGVDIKDGLLSEWKLQVTSPSGTAVFSANGVSNPPAQIPWVNPTKLEAGDYIVQMVGTTITGAKLSSARLLMSMLQGTNQRAQGTLLDTIDGSLFDRRQRVTYRLRNKLKRLVRKLSKQDESESFLIEVHGDGTGDPQEVLTQTVRESSQIRNLLILNGVDEQRLQVVGVGNERRLSDATSREGQKKNRRIEIRLLPSTPEKPVQDWAIHVNDKPVALNAEGNGIGRLSGEVGSRSTVRVVSPEKNALEQLVTVEDVLEPLEDDSDREMPFGIPKLNRSLVHQKKTGKPAPALAVSTLQVELPPDGSELGHPVLPIVGRAPQVDGLQIRINGQQVPVEGGHFQLLLSLGQSEESKVIIEARDGVGNVARIERTYRVKGNALFLLALADGALTQTTTQLPGVSEKTSIRLNDVPGVNDLFLHGRGVLYLKARIRGNELLKTVHIKAYADSARQREGQAFVEQVIDPKRFYPVYGDQSTEVSDVKTRGKYYVAVEADPGKIVLGTIRAGDWGVEMLRYDRMMEGAQLDLKKAFVPGFDTVIKGFVSTSDRKTRRGQVTLRGTGGSYYFLPHRDLIEGTERISISIRDRDTGAVLQVVPQVADMDYRIDYTNGNVTFRKPVPSHATANFMLGASDTISGSLALQGHPIFVRVDYETRDSSNNGELAWGLYGRQEIAGMASFGGGYLREGNQSDAGPDYELWGTDASLRWGRTMRLSAEVAHSRSSVGSHRISEDGGLTYRSIGPVAGGQQEGWGLSVRAEGDLGEWIRPDNENPFLKIRGRYRRQDSGFSSSHNVLERGMEHGGGDLQWYLNRNQKLTIRHDTIHTDRADSSLDQPTGHFSRMLSTAQYQHRLGRFNIVGELLHSLDENSDTDAHSGHRGAASAMLRYRVNPRLSLFLQQQGHMGGDDLIFRSGLDRLVTGIGAEVHILNDLSLSIAEHLRWSGEDTALIGLRTKLSQQSELYAEHRLHSVVDSERRVPELVVGSEERWGSDQSGRSYAEYKTGQANGGLYSRAVAGIGRSYKITRGLTADIAYERSHRSRIDGIGSDGDSNSLSIGVAYLGNKNLSLTSRFETRYESMDVDRLQLVSLNRLLARITPTTELIVRANMGVTQDLDRKQREAETLELNVGLAYRPLGDDFSLLLRAARIVDMRPVSLDQDSGTNRSTSDVISIEPIVSLPIGFQLGPKLAYRHRLEEAEGYGSIHSHTVLAALRLALKVWGTVDLAGEYRWFYVNLSDQMEHGALAELAVHITRYARIGAGYNFSHFDDNLFDALAGNTHGFFVRLTGIY